MTIQQRMLSDFVGQRVEVEIEGNTVKGRVVRGTDRKVRFLEERSPGDWAPEGVGLLKKWGPEDLTTVRVVRVLPGDAPPPATRKAKPEPQTDVGDDLQMAMADPGRPPSTWKEGPVAWAKAVEAARLRLSGRARRRRAARRTIAERLAAATPPAEPESVEPRD